MPVSRALAAMNRIASLECASGYVEGAINIPLHIVVYCRSGGCSGVAQQFLNERSYAHDIPNENEDKAITTAAKSDPDAQPLTPAQLKVMILLKDLPPPPHSHKTQALRPYR